jgi:hypothetical protein
MTVTVSTIGGGKAVSGAVVLAPGMAQGGFLLVLAVAAAAGFAPESSLAVSHAGADLTRLLRFMAVIKAVIAVGAAAVVFWRLAVPVSLPWFAAYAMAGAAMAAGPGVIWGMAHVGLGALLLHGGLFATILLLWRDPATSGRMQAILARRR